MQVRKMMLEEQVAWVWIGQVRLVTVLVKVRLLEVDRTGFTAGPLARKGAGGGMKGSRDQG